MNKPLPFPITNPLMKQQMEQYCYRCVDERCSDETFHFEVLLPKEWKAADRPAEPPGREAPATLAVFRPFLGPVAELAVYGVVLAREIAPADWLRLYLEEIGEGVVAERASETPGDAAVDVLTRRQTEGGPLISRWRILKDHNRLFLLQARCREETYPAHALSFLVVLDSFTLLHPTGWPVAENLNSFSRRVPGDFCLFYPESWTLEETADTAERVLEVEVTHRIGPTVRGRMLVRVVARTLVSSPQSLVDSLVGELRRRGIELPPVPVMDTAGIGGFEATWQGQARGTGPSALDLRVTIGKRPDAWFLLVLLGPASEADAVACAINTRAYEVLRTSFRTPTEEQVEGASCRHDAA